MIPLNTPTAQDPRRSPPLTVQTERECALRRARPSRIARVRHRSGTVSRRTNGPVRRTGDGAISWLEAKCRTWCFTSERTTCGHRYRRTTWAGGRPGRPAALREESSEPSRVRATVRHAVALRCRVRPRQAHRCAAGPSATWVGGHVSDVRLSSRSEVRGARVWS